MSAVADVRPALIGHLKDLHLPTVRECYEETARRAERETLSYEQYLLEVMARECEQRRKSKVQRLLKDSALPLEKSLQNFNLKRLPAKAARQLRTLLEGGFLDRKRKRSGVRQSWVGEESSFKRAGPGTGSGGGA
jgi:DNA replication protein DnaC